MNDKYLSRTPPPLTPRRTGNGRLAVAMAFLAFVLGAAAVAYLAWADLLPIERRTPDRLLNQPGPAAVAPPAATPPIAQLPAAEAALAVRIAALEQRLASIDLRAQAASGNASRAEGLLVALAARRALDKGSPLGYLEDQLRLRFNARHGAEVNQVIDAAKSPVTLDTLAADLEVIAPRLAGIPARGDFWQRAQQELSALFVVRHDDAPSPAPQNRLERARLMLSAGRIAEAAKEIEAMPGHAAARDWLVAARRYDGARRALDTLESAALLESVTPADSSGKSAEQPSPVIVPPGSSI
ncbi:hypothetical protein [Novosphingobium sp. TH158]|uniref:hypothetical protein n=1 Tax=Novosphingobium sp. TH158 TaxID=2067455 RepID=UPI000C7BDE40|nr:hypothetical protein [Novosphingobium sp. TH158]PLK27668.1 hypothetical protein C0V78_12810 [Novosphingobium sp. TH158]